MKLKKIILLQGSWHLIFTSILLLLLPVTLLTGPFLPDLFLSIIGLYFIYIALKQKLYKYFKNYLVYFFTFFYFYLFLRGIFSEYPYESLIKYNGPIFYFRYLFFILGMQYLLNSNNQLIKYFSLSLISVILFSSIDGYFQWIMGFNFFGFRPPSIRVTGIFNSEEILGHFLAHVTPLAIALLTFVFGSDKKKILIYIGILMFVEIMIFISNDRAAFLKIFQFTLLLILLSNHFKVFRLVSFGISSVIIFILILYAPDSAERFQHTVSDVSQTTIPYMPWAPSHETHFAVALDMFFNNPIFGQGPQLFKTLCSIVPEYISGCTSHPHNYYIQTLGEMGIIGFLFLFIFFLYISYILLMHFLALWFKFNYKNLLNDHYLFTLSFLFILLWPLIPHQSFYNNWLNVMVFMAIGFFNYFKSLNN